jgi:mannose-1-phosphate guanylyltransferase
MLRIWFELFRRYSIDEVLINLHSHADSVRQFIEKNKNGLKVHLFEEKTLLGSAGTLLANRSWVRHEASFWVFYADVLTTVDMDRMLDVHRRCGQIATIGVCEVPDPTRCGVVQIDGAGIVRSFVEKPAVPIGRLAFSGLMLASPLLLDAIPKQSPVDLGFHVLPQLVGRMAAHQISDFLIDIGTIDTYRTAQLTWPGFTQIQRNISND